MNFKLLVVTLLLVASTYGAVVATGTDTIVQWGVRRHCHFTCATCAAPEDPDKCMTCVTAFKATVWDTFARGAGNDSVTAGASCTTCATASEGFLIKAGNTPGAQVCQARAALVTNDSCPAGSVLLQGASDTNVSCIICTAAYKECEANADLKTMNNTTGSKCVSTGTFATPLCTALTGFPAIPNRVSTTACPDGYYKDATTFICKILGSGCTVGTVSTCTTCAITVAGWEKLVPTTTDFNCKCDGANGWKIKADNSACECAEAGWALNVAACEKPLPTACATTDTATLALGFTLSGSACACDLVNNAAKPAAATADKGSCRGDTTRGCTDAAVTATHCVCAAATPVWSTAGKKCDTQANIDALSSSTTSSDDGETDTTDTTTSNGVVLAFAGLVTMIVAF